MNLNQTFLKKQPSTKIIGRVLKSLFALVSWPLVTSLFATAPVQKNPVNLYKELYLVEIPFPPLPFPLILLELSVILFPGTPYCVTFLQMLR